MRESVTDDNNEKRNLHVVVYHMCDTGSKHIYIYAEECEPMYAQIYGVRFAAGQCSASSFRCNASLKCKNEMSKNTCVTDTHVMYTHGTYMYVCVVHAYKVCKIIGKNL